MQYETQFLYALLLTVGVEGLVVVPALRIIPGLRSVRFSLLRVIGAGVLPSAATLPYFWFVLPAFIQNYLPRVVIGEISIFLIEAILLRLIITIPLKYCMLLSLLANGASIGAGLVVFR